MVRYLLCRNVIGCYVCNILRLYWQFWCCICLDCIRIQLGSVENRRYKALVNLSREIQSKEKKAVQNMVWFCDELQLEMQRHRLTALQGMKYNNKAEFM